MKLYETDESLYKYVSEAVMNSEDPDDVKSWTRWLVEEIMSADYGFVGDYIKFNKPALTAAVEDAVVKVVEQQMVSNGTWFSGK